MDSSAYTEIKDYATAAADSKSVDSSAYTEIKEHATGVYTGSR